MSSARARWRTQLLFRFECDSFLAGVEGVDWTGRVVGLGFGAGVVVCAAGHHHSSFHSFCGLDKRLMMLGVDEITLGGVCVCLLCLWLPN